MANYESPKCADCEFGKGHCRPNKINTVKKNPMKEQDLKKEHLLPGKMVYADHYISRAPGRLYHTKGKSDQSDICSGGCVFIDYASGYVSIKHQVAINTTETVKAKLTFEREAQSQGVAIKGYHTDNVIFNSSELMEDLLKKQQHITFSLAVTSHQNGAAERAIKTVVTMERTMLMQATLICPEDTLYTDLWPTAMDYAVWVYNLTPDMQSGLSAIEIWSSSRFEPVSETLSNCHVWVCPTYVLEPKFQKPGVKIPKWAPRSLRGVKISPQYHVIFDDMFSNVMISTAADPEV